MRKLILRLLFGANVDEYTELLNRFIDCTEKYSCELDDHQKTIIKYLEDLESHRDTLDTVKKLIVVCQNHGIDVDEEIKHVKL